MSYLAPTLGIPAFAIPGLGRIATSLTKITPVDVAVTLARVVAALVASFVVGLSVAICMYLSESLEKYLRPMVRILMAMPVVKDDSGLERNTAAFAMSSGVAMRPIGLRSMAPLNISGMLTVPGETTLVRMWRPAYWRAHFQAAPDPRIALILFDDFTDAQISW
eukprot:gene30866-41065_t